jgi:undecaprenyl-diphosphatase
VNLAAVLPAIDGWGAWAYAALFAVAVFESAPVLGIAVPGATAVAVVGFAASQGILALAPCFWVVAAGAALGDVGGYLLGRRSLGAFSAEARWLNERHLHRSQAYFARWGNASVFFGRFVGPLRATVPFVAGASRMPFAPFLFWNIVSALAWSAAWLALGWVSGGALLSVWDIARSWF